jgi:DNA polymerase-1
MAASYPRWCPAQAVECDSQVKFTTAQARVVGRRRVWYRRAMADKLLLVDAYSMIYRAFYAIRSLNGPDGQPVNAIFGFTKMLRKLMAEQRPTHAAVVYDLGAPQQRLDILPSYKEQRAPTPTDLEKQLPAIREVLTGLRIAVVEREGEEADDIIATLAKQAEAQGVDVLIASGDKDFMQLVSPRIRLLRANGKEPAIVDPTGVKDCYGLEPCQMVDYFSLIGDAVDNIPGVAGIGKLTATALLQQFGTAEAVLAAAAQIPKPRLRETLLVAAEQIKLNRSLVKLNCEVPGMPALAQLRVQKEDEDRLRALYTSFGFRSLAAELAPQTPDLFSR